MGTTAIITSHHHHHGHHEVTDPSHKNCTSVFRKKRGLCPAVGRNIGWDDDDDVINNGTNVPEKSFPESQTVYQNPSFRISTEIDQAVTKGESLQNNSEKGN